MKKLASLRLLAGVALALFPLVIPSQGALLAYYSFDSDLTDGSGNANNLNTGGGTPNITSTAGEHVFGG